MKILNMVCAVFSKSEYIEGCDIIKFGEGCEKCLPFDWSPIIISISFMLIIIVIFLIYHLRTKQKRKEI